MFPNRINANNSPTPPTINDGESTNASLSSQGSSQSTISREKPRVLADLPRHRKILLASEKPVVRKLGEDLKSVHTQFENNEITSDEFLDKCHEIRETAEMHVELKKITEQEYLTVCDDLAVLHDPDRGIAAVRQRREENESRANRDRGNFDQLYRRAHVGETYRFNFSNLSAMLRGASPLENVRQVNQDQGNLAASGGPAPASAWVAARAAIERGVSAEQAIADHGLTDPEDVVDMRAVAASVAASGGPRAPASAWVAARAAIERGVSAEQAIADHGLTHPEDVADMRAVAARVAANRR